MSEVKCLSAENSQEWVWRCKKGCSRRVLQRERKGVVPISPMLLSRSDRHYLPSFSSDNDAPENIVQKEMAKSTWISVSVGDERKREVMLELLIFLWQQESLQHCFSNNCSTRKRDARDVLSGILEYGVHSGRTERAVTEMRTSPESSQRNGRDDMGPQEVG